MNRTQLMLLGLILVEVAAGTLFTIRRSKQTTPPVPDLADTDAITAADLRRLADECRTADSWRGLGEAYLANGFFPEAEACLRHAVALNPVEPRCVLAHAFALERLGELETANTAYQRCVELSHRTSDCHFYVGRNHLRRDQIPLAMESFRRAGANPAARFEIARLEARAGRVVEAETALRPLLDQFPDAFPVASLQYRLALAKGDAANARLLADKFPRCRGRLPNPFDTEVDWLNEAERKQGRPRVLRVALDKMRAGKFDEAERELRQAQSASWSPTTADQLAEVVFLRGEPIVAIEFLTEAVERGGPSFELLWRLGQAYDATGRSNETPAVWERAARVATGPGSKDFWMDLADRHARTGAAGNARSARGRALLLAGIDSLERGQPDDAARVLLDATSHDSSFAPAWFFLGESHRAAGRPADARAAYGKCLQENPDHGRARRALELIR